MPFCNGTRFLGLTGLLGGSRAGDAQRMGHPSHRQTILVPSTLGRSDFGDAEFARAIRNRKRRWWESLLLARVLLYHGNIRLTNRCSEWLAGVISSRANDFHPPPRATLALASHSLILFSLGLMPRHFTRKFRPATPKSEKENCKWLPIR